MIIDVNGRKIEVDDSFADLSEEEQQAEKASIAESLGYHQEATQAETKTEEKAAEPAGAFDMMNPESTARKVLDPVAAGVSMAGDAAKFAYEHKGEIITGLGAASYVPLVNKLPGIRDIRDTRIAGMQKIREYLGQGTPQQKGPLAGPVQEGGGKSFTPGTGQKIPITSVQPNSPGQPQVQPQPAGGFQRGQFNMPQQPSMNTGMPSAVQQGPAPVQQGTGQAMKSSIFQNPNAGNYIERMSELSKAYGEAQQRIKPESFAQAQQRIRPESFAQTQPQPQAQPQPKPSSGFPRGPMRGGGGGGGGGGAMVFDPTQRRKPLQF